MKGPGPSRRAGVAVVVLAMLCSGHGAMAQGPGARPSPALPSKPAPQPPLPPSVRPPVELFMELLAASPARREQLLEGKPASARQVIERRIAEFERLDPVARADAEWQLRLAQFRIYLSSLLSLSPAQRAERLAGAPEQDRQLMMERLKAWDALDDAARRQVLESKDRFHHFVASPAADPGRLARMLETAPGPMRPDIEAQFDRWRALPEGERRARSAAFQAIFELPGERRARALKTLDEAERKAMDRTLERFSKLPAAERDRCIAGLERLARLDPAGREAFLRNAALWQAMTPSERDQWRRLVFNLHAPPLPPMPSSRPSQVVVTNQ